MTTNYHTQLAVDGTTIDATDLNTPLGELDAAIATQSAARSAEISSAIATEKSERESADSALQDQIDILVVNGDSSVEAAAARVGRFETHGTLKERLDRMEHWRGANDAPEMRAVVVDPSFPNVVINGTVTEDREPPNRFTMAIAGQTLRNDGEIRDTLPFVSEAAKNVTVEGGTWRGTTDDWLHRLFHGMTVYSDRFTLRDTNIISDDFDLFDPPRTDLVYGSAFQLYDTSKHAIISNLRARTKSLAWIGGQGHVACNIIAIQGGADDGWVYKQLDDNIDMERVALANILFQFNATGIAYGTEVKAGKAMRDTTHVNVICKEVGRPFWIKPGREEFQGGIVERSITSNVTSYDPTGLRHQVTVTIETEWNAIVRDVIVQNVTSYGRCAVFGDQRYGVFILSRSSSPNGYVRDVLVSNVNIRDAHEGVNEGVNGAVGHPYQRGVVVEEEAGAGTVTGIVLRDFFINGTERDGILVTMQRTTSRVVFEGSFQIKNYGIDSGATYGLRVSKGTVDLTKATFRMESALNRIPFFFGNDAIVTAEVATVYIDGAPAGTDYAAPCWVAPDRCYIFKVTMIHGSGFLQSSNVSYSTWRLLNTETGGLVAGTSSEADNFANAAIQANKVIPLHDNYISNTNANAFAEAGHRFRFSKTDTGSGNPLERAYLTIHYIRY